MKLFGKFEAVRFPEENLIFITDDGFLYYIYNPEHGYWRKHKNAGNDSITVRNYQEVSREEIMDAMHGIFPAKATDFMRLCRPSQLNVWNMLSLLEEDYSAYMADSAIYDSVYKFLLESDICHRSFSELQKLFRHALSLRQDDRQVLIQIHDLCFAMTGKDIFREEIGIIDGHDPSSYFWIMPVRVIDYTNTNDLDSVAEMKSAEISIEEDDVAQYLLPFLNKYYDDELEANKKRVDSYDENEQPSYVSGFEWYLTHNFYTHDSMMNLLKAMRDTVDALSAGEENEFTIQLREKRGSAAHELLYVKDWSEAQIKEYNANRPTEDHTDVNLIIDFYRRFIFRMEYMIKIAKEKAYPLISVMGP